MNARQLEVFRAMRFAFEHLKLVVEPGGAVALARASFSTARSRSSSVCSS